jgi:hypothetical protein
MEVGEDEKIVTLCVPCLSYLFVDKVKCKPTKMDLRTHLCIRPVPINDTVGNWLVLRRLHCSQDLNCL